jgi:hypothetical protein
MGPLNLLGSDAQLRRHPAHVVGCPLRFVDEQGRTEISAYLQHAGTDQGGIVQLMPEVMELFNAVVGDNPRVRYGCIVSAGPPPHARNVPWALLSPIRALQLR